MGLQVFPHGRRFIESDQNCGRRGLFGLGEQKHHPGASWSLNLRIILHIFENFTFLETLCTGWCAT
jgi:hypothetical protein